MVFYICFFNDTATTEIYTYGQPLSLHDALPISNHRADIERRAAERERHRRRPRGVDPPVEPQRETVVELARHVGDRARQVEGRGTAPHERLAVLLRMHVDRARPEIGRAHV